MQYISLSITLIAVRMYNCTAASVLLIIICVNNGW